MHEAWLRKRLNLIWEVELKHETSQTCQFGHMKETREWILNKTASTLGLSYECSSKKRKNTYLWTRCGHNCCALEHIKKRILQFVSIWERMWEMNFIRCGDISKFQFSILKALTLREFLVFRQLWLYTNPERNCSDRKTGEERLTLSPRLQLFVTFCSVEPLYCALRLPSAISPAQSPRSFDVSSLFTYMV